MAAQTSSFIRLLKAIVKEIYRETQVSSHLNQYQPNGVNDEENEQYCQVTQGDFTI